MTDKQAVLDALQRLPENTTLSEIAEELRIMAAIRRGRDGRCGGARQDSGASREADGVMGQRMTLLMRLGIWALGALVFYSFTVPAHAESVVTLPGVPYWTGPVAPASDDTFGYSFTVGDLPLSVNALGLFGPNFATAHSVGLWDESGILLASVVIPSVTPEFVDGRFGYVGLSSPVILAAHESYVLGASYSVGDGVLWYYLPGVNPADISVYSSAVVPGDIRDGGSSGFGFPSLTPSPGGAFGPNARFVIVPEPSAGALILVGVGTIGLVHKISQRKRQKATKG